MNLAVWMVMIASKETQVGSETARDTSMFSVSILGAITFGACALVYQYMMDEDLTLKCNKV
jgi:hypothetical protein